jgi:type II secretory pathway pseudopilin PulG
VNPAHHQDSGRNRSPRDRGSTLVEIVVAVTLLAVLIVPVMRSVIVSIRASTTATAASEVETALLNAVDRVNRSPVTSCDYSQYAEAAMLTQGWSEADVVVEHFYLDTTLPTPDWVAGPPGAAACPGGLHRDDLIQKVSISVTDPGDKVSRTIQVVKSNV